ncbi:MAG: hypothetical protein ACKON8_08345 [Planctomycetota bacterium]
MSCFVMTDRTGSRAADGRRDPTVWLAALALVLTAAAPAQADWNPGDPFKMHFPQLPDPNGWDVLFVGPANEVADDWACTETGPVTDLHFWYSVQGDGTSTISSVTATIYSDNPSPPAPFSTPAALLWSGTFTSQQFVTRLFGSGSQGFADPKQGPSGWTPADHLNYYQLNITGIENPFVQTQGTIYWLGLNVGISGTSPIGWKTSINAFNDDAAYLVPPAQWNELVTPSLQSLNMAFVVTPEPTGAPLAVAGLAVVAWLARRQRRRAGDGTTPAARESPRPDDGSPAGRRPASGPRS